MTLPVFRRFSLQDLPSAPNWMEQVIVPLNLFCETTVSALNKNLTIGENVQGQTYSTSFTTPEDYLTGKFNPFSFAYHSGGQPKNLLIGKIERDDNVLIIKPYALTRWILNINTSPPRVTVGYIAGLDELTKYNVTLLVI